METPRWMRVAHELFAAGVPDEEISFRVGLPLAMARLGALTIENDILGERVARWHGLPPWSVRSVPRSILARLLQITPEELEQIHAISGEDAISNLVWHEDFGVRDRETLARALSNRCLQVQAATNSGATGTRARVLRAHLLPGSKGRPRMRVRAA